VSFKKSDFIFYSILVGSLMLAPAQAFVLAETIRDAEVTARTHPLNLRESLPGWQRTKLAGDIEQSEVLERHYSGTNGTELIVVARQASLYNFIHDLYFCMTSNEQEVNVLGKRSYSIGANILNGTLIEDKDNGTSMLSLMWFQNQAVTAADRIDWRLAMIKNPKILQLPLCRNVRVSIKRSSNMVADENALVAAAKQLYGSSF